MVFESFQSTLGFEIVLLGIHVFRSPSWLTVVSILLVQRFGGTDTEDLAMGDVFVRFQWSSRKLNGKELLTRSLKNLHRRVMEVWVTLLLIKKFWGVSRRDR